MIRWTFDHDTQIHQRCESSASDTGSTASRSQTVGHIVERSLAVSRGLLAAAIPILALPLLTVLSPTVKVFPLPGPGVPRRFLSSSLALVMVHFFDNAITNSSSSHNPSWGDGPTPPCEPLRMLLLRIKERFQPTAAPGSGTDGKCSARHQQFPAN